MRKDFNGAQVTVGKYNPKWGPTDEASILFGVSGDRGHIVGGFSHNRRAMIYTNTRPWGSTPGASTFGNNYVSVDADGNIRSEEHTSELQSLMRNTYAVLCLKKKHQRKQKRDTTI